MKLNKVIFSAALALTVALAATGCKKGYSGITPMGQRSVVGTGEGPGTLPSTPPFGGDQGVGTGTGPVGGPIPTTADWDPNNMNQDHTALAAYTVHFAFDSATIKDGEQGSITSVAQYLSGDASAKLLIEGNCDERGTEEYNRTLGDHRALALREALVKDGVDANRIRTISYGKDKPADPGHGEAAWAKNRRGDFVVCHPKS